MHFPTHPEPIYTYYKLTSTSTGELNILFGYIGRIKLEEQTHARLRTSSFIVLYLLSTYNLPFGAQLLACIRLCYSTIPRQVSMAKSRSCVQVVATSNKREVDRERKNMIIGFLEKAQGMKARLGSKLSGKFNA